MEINNNSIIFILLGMMGLIGVIGIIALLFRFGASIEVAVLVPIPTGVIAALATAIRRTNANSMEKVDDPSDNGNKTDNEENTNSKKDNINKDNINKDNINKDNINKDNTNKDNTNKDNINKDNTNKNTNKDNIPVVEETDFNPEHGTVPLSPEYPIDPGQIPEETLNNFSDSEEGC